jgi:hypothetical protein
MITVFVLGAVLLFVPLILVVGFSSIACNVGTSSCIPFLYKMLFPALPYVMIVGGVLIGYNMKRISDSLLPEDEDEGELLHQ